MNTIPSPAIQAEIISTPAVHQMTVTPAGSNMFSLNLNVVMVVRFPDNDTEHATAQTISNNTPLGTSDVAYADGSQPAPGGETAAFQDFLHAHGYPTPTRQSLSEWVQSQFRQLVINQIIQQGVCMLHQNFSAEMFAGGEPEASYTPDGSYVVKFPACWSRDAEEKIRFDCVI